MLNRLALAAMFLFCAATSAVADNFLGGEGGGVFGAIECPRGTAIVGFAGRAGAVIDSMQLVCGTTNRPEDDIIDSRVIGPSTGGGPIRTECPPFQAVKSIQVAVNEFQGHFVISTINIQCMARLDGGLGPTLHFGNFQGQDAGSQGCASPNAFALGLAGRSGSFIDAVGVSSCVERRNLGN
jgi:hypothetical protein